MVRKEKLVKAVAYLPYSSATTSARTRTANKRSAPPLSASLSAPASRSSASSTIPP